MMPKAQQARDRAIQLTLIQNRIKTDARSSKNKQIHPEAPTEPPSRIRRAGGQGMTWDISRSMGDYKCVSPESLSIQGKAPKWILINSSDPNDFYIAKLGSKNGDIEVLTELFSNEFGTHLGFPIAHHGMVRLDKHLYFLTRNFKKKGFALVHGSLLVADALQASESEVHNISRKGEQEFYEIGLIFEAITNVCKSASGAVFQGMIDMLVFDALIGCMDRHAMNWGILRPEKVLLNQDGYRFAPIFDSARGLAWDLTEANLLKLDFDEVGLEAWISRASPCIGPKRSPTQPKKCSHFDLMENLRKEYPHQIECAWTRLGRKDAVATAKHILGRYPYKRGFTELRKRVIIRVLAKRSERLSAIFGV